MAHLRPSDLPDIPAGSAITVEETVEGLRLQWRNPGRGIGRYALALFLMFWLGGWAVGAVSATKELVRQAQEGSPANLFLLCWLGLWLIGGGFALYFLVRLVGRGRPESLFLGENEFRHRAGAPPFTSFFPTASTDMSRFWGHFRRAKETVAHKHAVGNVLLERVGEHQRLSVDVGADRIEIGEFLREPEREWLAQLLQMWFAES